MVSPLMKDIHRERLSGRYRSKPHRLPESPESRRERRRSLKQKGVSLRKWGWTDCPSCGVKKRVTLERSTFECDDCFEGGWEEIRSLLRRRPSLTERIGRGKTEPRTIAALRVRLKKYGLSARDYERLLNRHQGRCGICEMEMPEASLVIDHDHKTGTVRGLLCGGCNAGLGMFKDSPSSLTRAAEYLRRRRGD